jgi:hypothetical protein
MASAQTPAEDAADDPADHSEDVAAEDRRFNRCIGPPGIMNLPRAVNKVTGSQASER